MKASSEIYVGRLTEQDDLEVADIRVGPTGVDKIAQRQEKRVGVILVEVSGRRSEASGARAVGGRRIDNRARRIGRAVDSVGADAGSDDERGRVSVDTPS